MAYAKRLTKERLVQEGFTEITKEGRLFKGEREIFPYWNGRDDNPNKYLCISAYTRGSDGRVKQETFGLHRVLWAWFYDEVPEGYVVDHINNKHSRIEDYHLDNLQLLTPKENITKERICNVWELKCKLDRPRSYFEDKLAHYEKLYEEAKANKDANKTHHLRSNIAQIRARLRYYDNHKEESTQMTEFKKDLMELKYWKERFREAGNKTMWHQCCKVEKLAKTETKENAALIVKHALDTLHGTFGGRR